MTIGTIGATLVWQIHIDRYILSILVLKKYKVFYCPYKDTYYVLIGIILLQY